MFSRFQPRSCISVLTVYSSITRFRSTKSIIGFTAFVDSFSGSSHELLLSVKYPWVNSIMHKKTYSPDKGESVSGKDKDKKKENSGSDSSKKAAAACISVSAGIKLSTGDSDNENGTMNKKGGKDVIENVTESKESSPHKSDSSDDTSKKLANNSPSSGLSCSEKDHHTSKHAESKTSDKEKHDKVPDRNERKTRQQIVQEERGWFNILKYFMLPIVFKPANHRSDKIQLLLLYRFELGIGGRWHRSRKCGNLDRRNEN